jgi:hypothetical protein
MVLGSCCRTVKNLKVTTVNGNFTLVKSLAESVPGLRFIEIDREDQGRNQGLLKGGSITVPLTSCLTGFD